MIASERFCYRGGVGEVRGLVRPVGEVPVRGLPVGDIPGLVPGLAPGDIVGDVIGDGEAVIPVPVVGLEVVIVGDGDGEDVVLPAPVVPVPLRLASSPQAPKKSARPKTPAPNTKEFFILRSP